MFTVIMPTLYKVPDFINWRNERWSHGTIIVHSVCR